MLSWHGFGVTLLAGLLSVSITTGFYVLYAVTLRAAPVVKLLAHLKDPPRKPGFTVASALPSTNTLTVGMLCIRTAFSASL